MSTERCPWAIKFGTKLATRCHLLDDGHEDHEGNGLAEFPYQTIHWLRGDRRGFTTDRPDDRAWETTFALPESQPDKTVIWRDENGVIVEDWHGTD